jgi:hypothetical protein
MSRPSVELATRSVRPARGTREDFFLDVLQRLSRSNIPFLVGGAFAMARYLGVERDTKDLDVFVRPEDVHSVLELFGRLGFHTEFTFPHWLGKIQQGDSLVDVIFSSGNGVARVDDQWFAHAPEDVALTMPVKLCPPEEMSWSKSFVQERERFDGADVMHLLRSVAARLDWPRLIARFGPHWRVLLAHLVIYGFVYPAERHRVPPWVMDELTHRLNTEGPEPQNLVCNGTLLSREQYLHDVTAGGYADARQRPIGHMTKEEIDVWTAAIGE